MVTQNLAVDFISGIRGRMAERKERKKKEAEVVTQQQQKIQERFKQSKFDEQLKTAEATGREAGKKMRPTTISEKAMSVGGKISASLGSRIIGQTSNTLKELRAGSRKFQGAESFTGTGAKGGTTSDLFGLDDKKLAEDSRKRRKDLFGI